MSRNVTVLMLILGAIQCCQCDPEQSPCPKKIPGCFGSICLNDTYCADNQPERKSTSNYTNGYPVLVYMEYDIDKVISVDTDLNIVGVQISLTQTWMDNRIYFKDDSSLKEGEWVTAPGRMYKNPYTLPSIWIPGIWIFSMKSFEVKKAYEDQSYLAVEKVMSNSSKSAWLKKHDPANQLDEGYFVHYLTQIDVYVKCPMDHNKFPFEEHGCDVEMTSSDLNKNYLQFVTQRAGWNNWGPAILNRETTRYFKINISELGKSEINITHYGKNNESWSVTGFKVQLTRNRYEFVLNYMFPSGLCVVISWITFIIPRENVDGRVAVLITLQLVLVTIFNGAQEKIPRPAKGASALDTWMLSMFVFVFTAFVSYATDLTLKKRRRVLKVEENKKDTGNTARDEDKSKLEEDLNDGKQYGSRKSIIENLKFDNLALKMKSSEYGHQTDRFILAFLIGSFFIYCIIYTIVYVM